MRQRSGEGVYCETGLSCDSGIRSRSHMYPMGQDKEGPVFFRCDRDRPNIIAGDSEMRKLVRESRAEVIITPHIGEAKRLLSDCWPKASKDIPAKAAVAKALIQRYRCTAVVKGAGTLVADPKGEAYINTTGNPGMATAGSGDVLTGIITSLAGQGLDAFAAARAGVFDSEKGRPLFC